MTRYQSALMFEATEESQHTKPDCIGMKRPRPISNDVEDDNAQVYPAHTHIGRINSFIFIMPTTSGDHLPSTTTTAAATLPAHYIRNNSQTHTLPMAGLEDQQQRQQLLPPRRAFQRRLAFVGAEMMYDNTVYSSVDGPAHLPSIPTIPTTTTTSTNISPMDGHRSNKIRRVSSPLSDCMH